MVGFPLRVDGLFMQFAAGEISSFVDEEGRVIRHVNIPVLSLTLNYGQTSRMVPGCCSRLPLLLCSLLAFLQPGLCVPHLLFH